MFSFNIPDDRTFENIINNCWERAVASPASRGNNNTYSQMARAGQYAMKSGNVGVGNRGY